MTSVDLDTLETWIGRTSEATDIVSQRLVDGYRATLAPYLAATPENEAPLGLHWCLAVATPPMAELSSDGHAAKGGFLPPVPLPRRMWAGGEIETLAAFGIGDVVTRRSTIAGIQVKPGRSGRLCFVTLRHDYAAGANVIIRERQDIVYRDAPPADAGRSRSEANTPPAAPEAAPEAEWRVGATPALLFRYSALTFNSHRIHYDHPYATGTEGYRGLVVHGPLQATLLFNLAASIAGRAPWRFSYRSLAPLVAGPDFHVRAVRQSPAVIGAWTQDADGSVDTRATAEFRERHDRSA